MNQRRRYAPSGAEAEFQPGSRRRVLRNLVGIRKVGEMNAAETRALLEAADWAVQTYSVGHGFTAEDLRQLHRIWLGSIYPWAGAYRAVNLAKGGFHFAAAREVPRLMREFEGKVLTRFTPCRPAPANGAKGIAEALAVVHAELVLIHPFREGNGRLARLLSALMGYQAGIATLDLADLSRGGRKRYIAAIHATVGRDYLPMQVLFERAIARSSGQ